MRGPVPARRGLAEHGNGGPLLLPEGVGGRRALASVAVCPGRGWASAQVLPLALDEFEELPMLFRGGLNSARLTFTSLSRP